VDDLELGAHEPPTTVVDMGTDELGLPDPDERPPKDQIWETRSTDETMVPLGRCSTTVA